MFGREPVLPQALGDELGVSRGGLLGTAAAVCSAFGPARGCETKQTGTKPCEPEALLRQGYRAFRKPTKEPHTGFLNRVSQVRFDHVGRMQRLTHQAVSAESGLRAVRNEVDHERAMVQISSYDATRSSLFRPPTIGAGRSAFSRSLVLVVSVNRQRDGSTKKNPTRSTPALMISPTKANRSRFSILSFTATAAIPSRAGVVPCLCPKSHRPRVPMTRRLPSIRVRSREPAAR